MQEHYCTHARDDNGLCVYLCNAFMREWTKYIFKGEK